MKRRVILYIAMSLDGYIADEDGGIDWLNEGIQFTEEDNNYEEFFASIDTVVLGRKTYDQIVNELSPNAYPYETKTSYVFTSKKIEDKGDIFFMDRDISSFISELKEEEGSDIWIVGGNKLINPLIKEDLIDEYKICIIPKILGSGIKLFDGDNPTSNLKAKSSYMVNGMLYTHYSR